MYIYKEMRIIWEYILNLQCLFCQERDYICMKVNIMNNDKMYIKNIEICGVAREEN